MPQPPSEGAGLPDERAVGSIDACHLLTGKCITKLAVGAGGGGSGGGSEGGDGAAGAARRAALTGNRRVGQRAAGGRQQSHGCAWAAAAVPVLALER